MHHVRFKARSTKPLSKGLRACGSSLSVDNWLGREASEEFIVTHRLGHRHIRGGHHLAVRTRPCSLARGGDRPRRPGARPSVSADSRARVCACAAPRPHSCSCPHLSALLACSRLSAFLSRSCFHCAFACGSEEVLLCASPCATWSCSCRYSAYADGASTCSASCYSICGHRDHAACDGHGCGRGRGRCRCRYRQLSPWSSSLGGARGCSKSGECRRLHAEPAPRRRDRRPHFDQERSNSTRERRKRAQALLRILARAMPAAGAAASASPPSPSAGA